MLFLVPFLCLVSALLFLNDGATCRQHSLRPFSHHQHKSVTWSGQRLVFGVHWCCAASVKDSKRAMMSTFPPSYSRGQKFFPMTSRRQQQPSFAFPNRGIKRDRSQTIRAAPGSFAAAEPPPLAALTVALTTFCHCVRQYNTACDLCRAHWQWSSLKVAWGLLFQNKIFLKKFN